MKDVHVDYEESTKNSSKPDPGKATVHCADDCVAITKIKKKYDEHFCELVFDTMELIFGVIVILAIILLLIRLVK